LYGLLLRNRTGEVESERAAEYERLRTGVNVEPEPLPDSRTTSFFQWLLETLLLVAIAVLLAITIRATVAEAFEVPSESMEPTIMTNDRILAEKVTPHWQEPRVGEVVVIKNPIGGKTPFVKRVVALPGQTVDLREGAVYVDGERLNEPYTHGLPSFPLTLDMPQTVPEGSIWVMGDNRTNSGDSRDFGPVPISTIIGRAVCVYWPLQEVRGLAR
jgi:signal peptidase I